MPFSFLCLLIMKNFDEPVKPNNNPNWSYIPDHPYKMFIFVGSGLERLIIEFNKQSNKSS